MSALSTARFVIDHPLNRGQRIPALLRVLRWQAASRLLEAPIALPFVNSTRLLVTSGMTGATGNWYCGLQEVDDMGFLLHYLRAQDTLFDVGANVGSYTILASGACGCKTVAIEPIPGAFRALRLNVSLNALEDRISLFNTAVGPARGHARFTHDLDTMNRMLRENEINNRSITVPVTTIDNLGSTHMPTFMKIDVEGSELGVLQGAVDVLKRHELRGLLVEINGSGSKFGIDDHEIHSSIRSHGFVPVKYDAIRRELTVRESDQWNNAGGNTLYLRDVNEARARVEGAGRHKLVTGTI